MMMRMLFAVALALSATGQAQAQASPAVAPVSVCKGLSSSLDDGLKELAEQKWTTSARSAPQATQLATEEANTLSIMQMNLTLLVANHCSMPVRPVSSATYMLPALQCATASYGTDEAAQKEKCDRAKWTPEGFPEPKK